MAVAKALSGSGRVDLGRAPMLGVPLVADLRCAELPLGIRPHWVPRAVARGRCRRYRPGLLAATILRGGGENSTAALLFVAVRRHPRCALNVAAILRSV